MSFVTKQVAGLSWRYVPSPVNSQHKLSDFLEKIMPVAKPDWEKDDVVTKIVDTGSLGFTNELIGFSVSKCPDDIVLIRINGHGTEKFLDREREIYMRVLFSQAKIGPPVYCEFENGLCYGYIPGEPVKRERLLTDDNLVQNIAKSMALLHSFKPPATAMFTNQEVAPIVFFDRFFALMWDDSDQCARFKEVYVSKKNLLDEYDDIKKIISKFTSPVVLCHNDLQNGNIIVDDGSVSFIDMEYAGPNYSACEIGDFFTEYAGINNPDYTLYPSEEKQKKFIKYYFDELGRLNGDENPVSNEKIHEFYIEANLGALVMHFLWIVWSVVQSHFRGDDSFDYMNYSTQRNEHYKELKKKFLNC